MVLSLLSGIVAEIKTQGKQTANGRQQTADSKQQTANGKQPSQVLSCRLNLEEDPFLVTA